MGPQHDVVMDADTVLEASSEATSLPVEFLQDPQRQKALRFDGPFVITNRNNKLDINRTGPGNYTVTLVSGTYTAAALATHITAQLETADATPVWSVTYSVVTHKFTIATAAHNFTLRWLNGPSGRYSCGVDLGFTTTADDTGTNSYEADNVAYQSRHWVLVYKTDGSNIAATVAIIYEHTATQVGALGVASKVTIQGNATDAWDVAPTFEEEFLGLPDVNALENPTKPCIQYFSTGQSLKYFRLEIDDVQNAEAITQIALLRIGTYTQFTICNSDEIQVQREEFTQGQEAISGAPYGDTRAHRDVYSLGWKEAGAADHGSLLQFFDRIDAWDSWYFDLTVGDPADVHYGYFKQGPGRSFVPYQYWDWVLQFFEQA